MDRNIIMFAVLVTVLITIVIAGSLNMLVNRRDYKTPYIENCKSVEFSQQQCEWLWSNR